MKTRILKLCVIILSYLIMGVGCQKKDDGIQLIQIKHIEKGWISSFEENTKEEIDVYRPINYKEFPLSRYRQIYIFFDDNSCEYLVLAPNDAHYMQTGNWSYDNNTKTIKIMDTKSTIIHEFEIIELNHDLLKISFR